LIVKDVGEGDGGCIVNSPAGTILAFTPILINSSDRLAANLLNEYPAGRSWFPNDSN
jgi:hypothetical protein